MPSLSHSSSSSSSRHSHRSSKHGSVSSALDRSKDRDSKATTVSGHSRTKSKSSSTSVFSSPREASSEYAALLSPSLPLSPTTAGAAAAITSRLKRPGMLSRAFSAPLVPQSLVDDDDEGEEFETIERSNSTSAAAGVGQAYSADEEIADDPFFQRYSLAHGNQFDETDLSNRIDSVLLSSNATTAVPQPPPEPYEAPLSPVSPQSPRYWNSSQPAKPQFQEINIVVVGASRVGKSTFIKQALDLDDMPPNSFTSRKVQMDGTVYVVRLIEVKYGDLDLDDEKCICWPDVVDNTPVPHIDGAFTLYDVTCKDSLLQVPETLSGLYNAQLPFLLVACKCDSSAASSPVDPDQVDAGARAQIGSIRTLRTSQTLRDSQKRCVAVLLRAIAAIRAQQLISTPNRRRATSSATQSLNPTLSASSKHSRANSEMSMSMFKGQSRLKHKVDPASSMANRLQSHLSVAANGDGKAQAVPLRSTAQQEDGMDELALRTIPTKVNSSLVGESFEDLVGRLLSIPRLKADTQFTDIFLALYRLFASPGQLLDTILRSFDVLSANSLPQMMKLHAQNRHLTVLDLWTSNYPGDFAHPYSHQKLQDFVNKISKMPSFASAATELAANLEAMVEDDDTDWALCDRDRSNVPSMIPLKLNTNGLTDSFTVREQGPTPVSPVALGLPHVSSTASLLSFVENATKQAAYLVPQPRLSLTKREWHILMDRPEEIIAKEMTRMDWTMFCSIRPRDLVRHVTMNSSRRGQCRSLENVQRMIDHFNHIALWTVNFILLRDKPKHRSFMLEKMMKIARELRKMNNYNSLGAVVAGINNSAIQRLHLTKELIDPAIGKDFLKLDILMGTQKSHSAYRLAWENTSGERIPFLPLHRRDLVTAADGNRTFVTNTGESDIQIAQKVDFRERKINWKKFEIMGNVVVGLQKAKETSYPSLDRHDDIKSLLIDLDMTNDEDRLYHRSKQLEPSAGDTNGRRFPWKKS